MPRILYIEDNSDNQRLVKRVLVAKGYQVDLAPEGVAGLEVAQANPPDLILMDINLPGLTGYELTTKFKALEQLQHIPIVALTANTMPGDRERALAAGCDGYISKPIDPRALPDQVAEYLGGIREELPMAQAPTFMREYSQQLVARLEDQIRELEAANERLLALDRAKSEFLATISHELRTPLTVIHGYVDLMNMQALGPLNDTQKNAMQMVSKNSHRLLRHINDLIYLQQVRSSELYAEETNLRSVVERVCKDVQKQLTERHQLLKSNIDSKPPGEPLLLMIDALGVENALRHLLENASIYTPEQGQITIAIKPGEYDVAVLVQDTGPGIAPEDQERIFEPFVRLDTSLAEVGGAGLGLVIARHVAQAHGGRLTLNSKPGVGSVFTLTLPRIS